MTDPEAVAVPGAAAAPAGVPPPADGDDLPPRRQHPAWIFLSALRQLRGLALPVAVLFLTGGRRGEGAFLAITGVLVLLGVAGRALAWWRFSYEIRDGALRVHSGLLSRRERFVPLERIQSVDTAETPLQRLFGVVGVRIETAAGSGGAGDVALEAVTHAEAERLQRFLDRAAAATDRVAPSGATSSTAGAIALAGDAEGELIRRITGRELLLAGATSGRIGPALAAFSVGFQLVDDLVPGEAWERWAMGIGRPTLQGVIAVLLVAGLLAWLLAVVGTAFTFANFELRRVGDRLLVTHGLFDRRRRWVPLARVQAVVLREGTLRRPFGLASLEIESAGYAGAAGTSAVLFPLLRRSEAPPLLASALPAFAASLDPDRLEAVPPRARNRYLLRGVWPLLALSVLALGLAALLPAVRWAGGLIPLALLPLAVVGGWFAFRDTGWRIDAARRFVVRNGGWSRRTTVVPPRRIQRRSTRQNPLQRRDALATLAVAVASGGEGGRVELRHLDAAVAADLLDRLGPERD